MTTRLLLIVTFLMALCTQTSVLHASVLDHLISKSLSPYLRSTGDSKNESGCADFSGKWAGKCTDSTGKMSWNDLLELKQLGCTTLDTGSLLYYVGGKTALEYSVPSGNSGLEFSNTDIFARWSAQRDTLLVTSNSTSTSSKTGQISTLTTQFNFSIVAGKLILQGSNSKSPVKITCQYSPINAK